MRGICFEDRGALALLKKRFSSFFDLVMKQRANLVMDNKENANAREARPRKLEVTEALPLVIPKIIGLFCLTYS